MSSLIRSFYNRYSQIIGLLGLIIGLLLGVYPIVHKDRPGISFEIVSEANVLDVHTPLKELAISFQGKDIQSENLNLRIITIRLTNTGDLNILPEHYDPEDAWGIEINRGKIVEARLVESNSEYIKSHLSPKLDGESFVLFKKIIFETDKFFTLELLVLHFRDMPILVVPKGKIAGIETPIPVKTWQDKGKTTFLEDVVYGNVFVHLVRFVAYIALFILSVMLLVYITDRVSRWNDARIRSVRLRKAQTLFRTKDIKDDKAWKALFDLYVADGDEISKIPMLIEDQGEDIIRELKSQDLLKQLDGLRAERALKRKESEIPPEIWESFSVDQRNEHFIRLGRTHPLIYKLIREQLLKVSEGKVQLDQAFERALREISPDLLQDHPLQK